MAGYAGMNGDASGSTAWTYRRESIETASPGELLIALYDQAIVGCIRRDAARARRIVGALIDGLEPAYGEMSNGLLALYDYCLTCLRQNDFDQPLGILRELRTTWVEALHRFGDAAA